VGGLGLCNKSVSKKDAFIIISETTARGRTPLVIRIVRVVPVELGLVIVQVEVGHIARTIAGTCCMPNLF
jgi:hypothetical protein